VYNSSVASNYHCPNQLLLVGIDVENDTLSTLSLRLSPFSTVHYVGKFLVGGGLITAIQSVGQLGLSTWVKKCAYRPPPPHLLPGKSHDIRTYNDQ
jgi:hypothetical protein